MAQFLTDENFDGRILRGLLRQRPELNIIRVQDVNLRSTKDQIILEWAYQANRVLLTHDISTITKFSKQRIAAGLNTAGIIFIVDATPIGRVIVDVFYLIDRLVDDWENTTWFVPLTQRPK
jgi:hypothetical protein